MGARHKYTVTFLELDRFSIYKWWDFQEVGFEDCETNLAKPLEESAHDENQPRNSKKRTSRKSRKKSITCPDWWKLIDEEIQQKIIGMLQGKQWSSKLVEQIHEEIGLSLRKSRAFMKWYFFGKHNLNDENSIS